MTTSQGQSAAMPSPFTPIAEYGFLSDCTPGRWWRRTVASTGCACPAFDSPSVFGSLLDRERARSASARSGSTCRRNARTSRAQRPRDDVEDTVGLGRRQRRADDRADSGPDPSRRTPTPGRRRRRAHAGADGGVHRRRRGDRARLRAGVRLRRHTGDVDARRRDQPHGRRHRAGADHPPAHRHGGRRRGRPGRARRMLRLGDRVYCSLSWADGVRPRRRRRGRRTARIDDHRRVLAELARPGAHPRPPLAGSDPALGAGDQGASPTCPPAPRSPP